MTPREKQIIFRERMKENLVWAAIAIVPELMIMHWLFFGYIF